MIAEIRRQFDLAWSLTELHLAALQEDDFLWQPAGLCWTVRRDDDGVWRPEWADDEPDPIPVPTIGWLTWHVHFWWSAAIAAVTGTTPPKPSDVTWPGDGSAAVATIRSLAEQWRNLLADMTDTALANPATFPWGADDERTVADTVLWVAVELTKNGSEIGQLRLLRAAGR